LGSLIRITFLATRVYLQPYSEQSHCQAKPSMIGQAEGNCNAFPLLTNDSQGYLKSLTAMSSQRSALSIQLSEQPAEHALHFFGLLGQFAVVLGIDQLQIPGQQQAVVQLAG